MMSALELSWSSAYIASLLAVALSDSLYRRIPNSLNLTILFLGMACWVAHIGLMGFWVALGGAAVGGVGLLLMYISDMVGAADVKVAFAFGALLGPRDAGIAVLAGSIVCGLISLRYLRPKLHWRGALSWARAEGKTVPMGAALAIGVLLASMGWV
jgi:prepilin peptidase CpaA